MKVKLLPIGNKLKPSLMVLFQNTADTMKKTVKIARFQQDQCKLLTKAKDVRITEDKKKLELARTDLSQAESEIKCLTAEQVRLKAERDNLKEQVEKLKQEIALSKRMQEREERDSTRQNFDPLFGRNGAGDNQDPFKHGGCVSGVDGIERPNEMPMRERDGRSNYNVLDFIKANDRRPPSPSSFGKHAFLPTKTPRMTTATGGLQFASYSRKPDQTRGAGDTDAGWGW
jgi:hypothetical protein